MTDKILPIINGKDKHANGKQEHRHRRAERRGKKHAGQDDRSKIRIDLRRYGRFIQNRRAVRPSNGIASKDEEKVAAMLPDIRIEMRYDDEGIQRMFLNGEDVTLDIRFPEASIYASDVSAMTAVRTFLLSMQKDMALRYNVVMDGRDIGTVVLPNAGLKIFMTARPEIRAERRLLELKEKNIETAYEDVLRDILYRDKNDSERSAAPLKAAADAILLDTTELSLEECLAAISKLAMEKLSL